jgi:hypothetical protein
MHVAGPYRLENGPLILGTWDGPCWPEGPGTQQRCWLLRLQPHDARIAWRTPLPTGGLGDMGDTRRREPRAAALARPIGGSAYAYMLIL